MCIILLEVFLGGGGRLVDFGPISPRMYLFMVGLIVSFWLLLRLKPIEKNFILLIAFASLVFLFSTVMGVINGAKLSFLAVDLKQIFVFYSIVFFYYAIRTEDDVVLITKLLKFSACFLAIGYLIVLVLLRTGVIPFMPFYSRTALTGEFFFRGESGFFYKGFLYICIGLLFFLAERKPSKVLIVILGAATVLTFTRGFFVSFLLTYAFHHVFIKQNVSKILAFALVTVVAIAGLWGFYYAREFNRQDSDFARLKQIEEVIAATTPVSFFIGHGYGVGVPSRPDRMEIVYLEAFHKQGLIGLSFWFFLFALNWIYFKRAYRVNPNIAVPFMLSTVFVYIQSFTNPYLNNPIGMTMVMISLVSLSIIGNSQPVSPESEHVLIDGES